MAASLGFAVFAREKRSRCADFLLTKPLGRTRTFFAKLLACVVGLLIVNLVFVAVSVALYEGTGEDSLAVSTVVLVALGMAGTQLVFLSLSVLLSVFMIKVTCSVERAETGVSEIPLGELVVGDVVHVAAGDMIPADLRVVVSKDLTVSQGTLTGESVPVNKTAEAGSGEGSLTDQPDLVFMGISF